LDRLPVTQDYRGNVLLEGELLRAGEAYAGAAEQYQLALDQESTLAPSDRAALRWKLASCLQSLGRLDEALLALEPLVAGLGDLPSAAQGRVCALRGWILFFLGQYDSALEELEKAQSLLAPTAEHADFSQAQRWLGYIWKERGEFARAKQCFSDALAAARRGDHVEPLAQACRAMGIMWKQEGDYPEAKRCFDGALKAFESLGYKGLASATLLQIGLCDLFLGRLEVAGRSLRQTQRDLTELMDEKGESLACIAQSIGAVRRGDMLEATNFAQRARALGEQTGFLRAVVLAEEALGDIAWESDNPAEARRYYDLAFAKALAHAPEGDLVYELEWRRSRSLLRAGKVDEAGTSARRAVDLARGQSDRRELGNALLALAAVSKTKGDHDRCRSCVDEAVDIFRRIETPYELARAHRLAADLLSNGPASRPDRIGSLLEAQRLFARCGALVDRDRVTEQLTLLESEARGTTDAGAADPDAPHTTLITTSPQMRDIVETARELADRDQTVLLEGETGTGKELVAHIIHESGPRSSSPFVAVNCAAVPQHLLESELFGHRRGAFTGADQDRKGLLESAGRGTVLLDEIDKATTEFQAKLLRVLEDRQIRPVGSSQTVGLQARILGASNRDLRALADQGSFLIDLYYRLSGFRLRLPPLRERREDIAPLTQYFLRSCIGRIVDTVPELSPDAEALLSSYQWPGNVRELRNVVESCAFFARKEGVIRREHLPLEIRGGASGPPDTSLHGRIEEVERREILAAMEKAEGVKTEAAKILGVSRKGLRERLRRLGLE
jgi:DNA-binding NtrC family response regulator